MCPGKVWGQDRGRRVFRAAARLSDYGLISGPIFHVQMN